MEGKIDKERKFTGIIKYIVVSCFLAGALIYLFFGPTAIRREINLRYDKDIIVQKKADKHIEVLAKAFSQHPELRLCRISFATDPCKIGCIFLSADLPDEKNVGLLIKAANDTNPPAPVYFHYSIYFTNTGESMNWEGR